MLERSSFLQFFLTRKENDSGHAELKMYYGYQVIVGIQQSRKDFNSRLVTPYGTGILSNTGSITLTA